MKTIEWKVPEGLGLQGTVTIEVPNYRERLDLVRGIGDLDGEGVEVAGKMYGLVERHVKSMSVHGPDGSMTTVDDLGYYAEGVELINAIGGVILRGVELGKLSVAS